MKSFLPARVSITGVLLWMGAFACVFTSSAFYCAGLARIAARQPGEFPSSKRTTANRVTGSGVGSDHLPIRGGFETAIWRHA